MKHVSFFLLFVASLALAPYTGIPTVHASCCEQIAAGVVIGNGQGNVTFAQDIYFDSRNNTANSMIFNVTTALHNNTNGQFTITLTPNASKQMQVSFIDLSSYPLSVISGSVSSATWIAANYTLVIYSLVTQQTVTIGLQALQAHETQNRILTYALVGAVIVLVVGTLAVYVIRKKNRRPSRP